MKKLIHIPKYIYAIVAFSFLIISAFMAFILTYKVEETIVTKVSVKGASKSVYVDSEIAYKIKNSDNINLKIGDRTYNASIEKITHEKITNLYKLELKDLKVDLLPNSTLDAVIIYSSKSIFSIIVNSS